MRRFFEVTHSFSYLISKICFKSIINSLLDGVQAYQFAARCGSAQAKH